MMLNIAEELLASIHNTYIYEKGILFPVGQTFMGEEYSFERKIRMNEHDAAVGTKTPDEEGTREKNHLIHSILYY